MFQKPSLLVNSGKKAPNLVGPQIKTTTSKKKIATKKLKPTTRLK